MADSTKIREGMQVYSTDDQLFGTVERLEGDGLLVRGQRIPITAVERVEQNRVYLTAAGAQYFQGAYRQQTEGEVRVPVAEERLEVEKRPAELGEVQVQKTVTEEQQTVPVELRREEVHVQRRDVADRPVGPGEAAAAFEAGTIRVPVRGEEAVARKEAVVTGEVVIEKEQTTQREQVGDTVRRERVEVDENYQQAGGGRQQAQVAPQAASAARTRPETAVAAGMDVVGSDGTLAGRVKEVRESDFLVDRSGQRDVYVPFSAIAQVAGNEVVLNVTAAEVDDQEWPKPSLF